MQAELDTVQMINFSNKFVRLSRGCRILKVQAASVTKTIEQQKVKHEEILDEEFMKLSSVD